MTLGAIVMAGYWRFDQRRDQPTHYFVFWDGGLQFLDCKVRGGNGATGLLQDLTHSLSYLVGERMMAMNVYVPAYYCMCGCCCFYYPSRIEARGLRTILLSKTQCFIFKRHLSVELKWN